MRLFLLVLHYFCIFYYTDAIVQPYDAIWADSEPFDPFLGNGAFLIEPDACSSPQIREKCKNNATCVGHFLSIEYECQCINGWSGFYCDQCTSGIIQDGICILKAMTTVDVTTIMTTSTMLESTTINSSNSMILMTMEATTTFSSTQTTEMTTMTSESVETTTLAPSTTPSPSASRTDRVIRAVWPPLAIAVCVAFVIIGGITLRRRFVTKTVFVPDGLPRFSLNYKKLPPTTQETFNPLHDALTNRLEPLGAISPDWSLYLYMNGTIGRSCLHAAVTAVSEKPENAIIADLELLFTEAVDVNLRDHAGYTPLHLAIIHCRPMIVSFLLDHGADANAYDYQRLNPLALAITHNSLECFKVLLNHDAISVNAPIEPEDTPLKMCILRGSCCDQFFDALLCHPGTDIDNVGDSRTGMHRTPLHVAVLTQNIYTLKWLIKKQAKFTAKDRNNKIPLVLAIEISAIEAAKLLIAAMRPLDLHNRVTEFSAYKLAESKQLTEIVDLIDQKYCKSRKRCAVSTEMPSAKRVNNTSLNSTSSTDSGCFSSPNVTVFQERPQILSNPVMPLQQPLMPMPTYQQPQMPMPYNGYSNSQMYPQMNWTFDFSNAFPMYPDMASHGY